MHTPQVPYRLHLLKVLDKICTHILACDSERMEVRKKISGETKQAMSPKIEKQYRAGQGHSQVAYICTQMPNSVIKDLQMIIIPHHLMSQSMGNIFCNVWLCIAYMETRSPNAKGRSLLQPFESTKGIKDVFPTVLSMTRGYMIST